MHRGADALLAARSIVASGALTLRGACDIDQ
jgi:hypothetical protein